jgi:hypothetical protein
MSRSHPRHRHSHSHSHSHYPFGFPHIFATPPQDGRVRIYQATLLQESPSPYSDSPPIYNIAPYRIFQPPDVSAFWVPLTEPDDGWTVMFVTDRESATTTASLSRRYREGEIVSTWEYPSHGSLTAPTREVFFHGHWSSTGRAILSMFCSTAIPILELAGSFRSAWPRHPSVPTSLSAGGIEVLRAWQRRWEADSWEEAIAREFADPEIPLLLPARSLPHPPPSMDDDMPRPSAPLRPTIAPAPPSIRTAIPTFVQEAVIRDAIARATLCPITMEPLTNPARITLTPCYHLFDAAALTSWCASGENKCPTCRTTL